MDSSTSRTRLEQAGIRPSAQRLAVADYVFRTTEHPSADEVLLRVQATLPMVSRATVYNTLNLFVRHGLLRELVIAEGHVVFDPKLGRHHHFIDAHSGRIYDLPDAAVALGGLDLPEGFEADEVQVVVRGRCRGVERERSDPSASEAGPS